jgi:hypothetical protein
MEGGSGVTENIPLSLARYNTQRTIRRANAARKSPAGLVAS